MPIAQTAYFGDYQILTALDAGELIFVDGRSFDSLNYIAQMGIEQDVYPLFQRMLRHDSVVVDVGANFGFYTIKAASRVAQSGTVYAFEGNPHTFALLKKTLYANMWGSLANITAHNVLVGNTNGVGEINYSLTGLGGASIWASRNEGDQFGSAQVKMVTLDDYLPKELVVDIVKIDVEGHEPYVLEGMKQIIARSPNIKIIAECFPAFFEKSYGGMARFQSLVRDLGLNIWKIHDLGKLTKVEENQILTTESYCLLARDISDIGEDGRIIVIDPRSLSVSQDLPKDRILVGNSLAFDVRKFVGHPRPNGGLVVHGPYIKLAPGAYRADFRGALNGDWLVRFQSDWGRKVHCEQILSNFEQPVEFLLEEPAPNFELALWERKSSRNVRIDRIELVSI
jgi:FkbM family methyltransferase